MKFEGHTYLSLFTMLLFCLATYGQDDYVFVFGKMKLEKGKLDGTMEVLENGSRVRIVKLSGNGKFEHKAEPNNNYIFSFSQEGFVTKKIALSSRMPPIEERADPYPPEFEFEVTLFKQYEGINFVVFNQPVAKAGYNGVSGFIEYDTDYTKSIQEQLALVQEQVEEAEKEEERNPKKEEKKEDPPPPPPPVVAKKEKKPEPKPEIKEKTVVKREDPPTTPRRKYQAPPPPPPKKTGANVVVLHSYTVGEMGFPNLNAYGFINFGDGAGRREITKEQFDEYAKKYHHTEE